MGPFENSFTLFKINQKGLRCLCNFRQSGLIGNKTLECCVMWEDTNARVSTTKHINRRIKINLRLRQKAISDEDDSYTDQVGWTVSHDDYEEPEAPINKEPEAIMHQCSMCGSMMRIPKPTRDRYTVICAHPECGHEDSIGV